MKIIELLNKIANNEEVPKKIKVSCYEFEWREGGRFYTNTTKGNKGNCRTLLQDWLNNANKLNSKVEIIEDEEEIDIQRIEELSFEIDNTGTASEIINQLVQAVKQLDKNIKELNK